MTRRRDAPRDAGAWAIARESLRATWRRRVSGYLALTLLVGGVGGLAMGAIAAARTTQASYLDYFGSSHSPNLEGVTAVVNPLDNSSVGYDPTAIARISRLPHVIAVANQVGVNVLPLRDGRPFAVPGYPPSAGNGIGFTANSPIRGWSLVSGRVFDPRRPDEMMIDRTDAALTGWRVGQRITFGLYTNRQTFEPGYGTARVAPVRTVTVRITGIIELASQVIKDDVDMSGADGYFTPALTDSLLRCCVNYTGTAVNVRPVSDVPRVGAEISRMEPRGFPAFVNTRIYLTRGDLALRPLSIALGGFGAIVAVAALVIGAQLVARSLRAVDDERRILRALGASPGAVAASGLAGVLSSLVVGAGLAAVVAIGLSPLAPIGPVRPFFARHGLSVDGTVLGFGALAILIVLAGGAIALEFRMAPHRVEVRRRRRTVAHSRVAAAAARAGVGAPASTGLHFALEPGTTRDRVPVRSIMVAGILSVMVLVTTVTFGASLDSLVAHPRLYGWNWDYLLSAGQGSGNAPAGPAYRLLNSDPYIKSWSALYSLSAIIDGQSIPVLGERPGSVVQPPLIAGHGLEAPGQVVLAPGTMTALHRRLGQFVTVATGSGSHRLHIVGEATFPTMGIASLAHLEMGTGALFDDALLPPVAKNPFHDPLPGPEGFFVRLVPGAGPRGKASLQTIAAKLSNTANFGVSVDPVLHPAQIVDYRTAGTTPAVLGGALGLGVIGALILTLLASARARRRDLAVLKSLGFTRRQVVATMVWQSTVAIVVSVVVGVPLGVVAGRELWDVFAREIYAVPAPTVPVFLIGIIAVASVAVADLAAAVPGRRASRIPAGEVLRAE